MGMITLIADASVSTHSQKSGWGYWAKGDDRPAISFGGPLGAFCQSTTVAELEALANGLAHLNASRYLRSTDSQVLLQCDNIGALACIRKERPSVGVNKHKDSARMEVRRKPLSEREKAAVKVILNLADEHGLTLSVRHVRGHQQGNGRNWVNRLCDKLANKGRKEAERQVAS